MRQRQVCGKTRDALDQQSALRKRCVRRLWRGWEELRIKGRLTSIHGNEPDGNNGQVILLQVYLRFSFSCLCKPTGCILHVTWMMDLSHMVLFSPSFGLTLHQAPPLTHVNGKKMGSQKSRRAGYPPREEDPAQKVVREKRSQARVQFRLSPIVPRQPAPRTWQDLADSCWMGWEEATAAWMKGGVGGDHGILCMEKSLGKYHSSLS